MGGDMLRELEAVLAREDATFDELVEVVATATLMMEGFKSVRDRAIVAADKSGPYADRRAIGTAAKLKPSSLYRILEHWGQPKNRRSAVAVHNARQKRAILCWGAFTAAGHCMEKCFDEDPGGGQRCADAPGAEQ